MGIHSFGEPKGETMTFSPKRGILLLGAAFLLVAAADAPPAPGHAPQGAQPLACPSLHCQGGGTVPCNSTPCAYIDNCSIQCGSQILKCAHCTPV
jgi:hypothetical protein